MLIELFARMLIIAALLTPAVVTGGAVIAAEPAFAPQFSASSAGR
ncbi:hypothetical protein [Oricola sp.]